MQRWLPTPGCLLHPPRYTVVLQHILSSCVWYNFVVLYPKVSSYLSAKIIIFGASDPYNYV